jgi:hypothetical protein
MFAFSLFESFGYPLVAPMILARTGGDEIILGLVQSVLGIGGIVGGAGVAVWSCFRKKIHGVLAGLLLTGLLADRVFEPAMRPGGAHAPWLGPLIGTGPGAGMTILLVVCGVLCAAVSLWGYLVRPIREIETILPDHKPLTSSH